MECVELLDATGPIWSHVPRTIEPDRTNARGAGPLDVGCPGVANHDGLIGSDTEARQGDREDRRIRFRDARLSRDDQRIDEPVESAECQFRFLLVAHVVGHDADGHVFAQRGK
jgi:hypothetical protein